MSGTVVAAVLILMFSISGTFGAYAEKGMGFFHWITKDESGVEVITTPQSGINAGVDSTQRYDSIDEVPDDVKKLIWIPEDISLGLSLQYVDVLSTTSWKRISCGFRNEDANVYFDTGIKIFESGVVFHKQTFSDFEFLYEKDIKGVDMEIFIKESDDEVEHAVCFYGEVEQYSVKGNLSEQELQDLAIDYARFIPNN